MPQARCLRHSHAAHALIAAAALLSLAACGASDGAAPTASPSNSTITTSACQNKPLASTRMSCPPSASASAAH